MKNIFLGSASFSSSRNSVFFEIKPMLEHFNFVSNANLADYIFIFKTIDHKLNPFSSNYSHQNDFPLDKVVLFENESPIRANVRWIYENYYRFHTVISYSRWGDNVFKFSDNPVNYPNYRKTSVITRKDLTLKTRNVFWAGTNHPSYAKVEDKFNAIILYAGRDRMVSDLSKYSNAKIYGTGWNVSIYGKSTKLIDNYHHKLKVSKSIWEGRLEDIIDSKSEFVLCIENSIQEGLLGDRLIPTMDADRVALYLGCPNIERYVPKNTFINLLPYFNRKTKILDIKKVMNIVANMSQSEYDNIIYAAREFRETIRDKFYKDRKKLTQFLIKRLDV